MKLWLKILVVLLAMAVTSCDLFLPRIPYVTDFSTDSGDFEFNLGESSREITEIADGVLHLRAIEYDGFLGGAQAKFLTMIPRGTVVEFDVKFGEYYNEQHGNGHFNFLFETAQNRINFMTSQHSFGYFTNIGGDQNDYWPVDEGFTSNRWYTFRYELASDAIQVYLDDILLLTVDYVDGLPNSGYMIFECHNEYWIDNFSVDYL